MSTAEDHLKKCLESGNELHWGSKWELDGSRRLREVQISPCQEVEKYHYVFELPANWMRKHPTRFDNFKQNRNGRTMMLLFHWFLDFIHTFVNYQDKKEPLAAGFGVIAFIEWAHSSTATKKKRSTAAWRLHVFINRKVNEMVILRQYFNKMTKEAAKLKKSNLPVPAHYNINTYNMYGSRVFRKYSGHNANFDELYNTEITNPEAAPSNLFKMTAMQGFGSLDSYNSDGSFTFPCMNFLKLDCEQISYEHFGARDLPDWALFAIFKPEVHVYEAAGGKYRLEFGAHRTYKDLDEQWQEVDEDGLQSFIATFGKKYLIWREGDTYSHNWGEITDSEELQQSDADPLLSKDPEDYTGKAHTMRAEMALCQAAESEIDMIKLEVLQIEEDRALAGESPFTPREKFDHILGEWNVRVWNDPDAFVSDPLKAVIEWFHRGYDHTKIEPVPLMHEKISVFGHQVINKMVMYETLYQVASAHRECFWLHLARLDAFRHDHNLHLNAMFIGDAATSKSFLQTQIEQNSIGKTTKSLTYQTTRSGAVDHDDNHFVRQFDEAPEQFLKDPKNKAAEPALKMMLVKGFQAHERPHSHKDTGERNKIVGISSCIGVMFGASNEGKGAFSDALRDRFHFFEAEKCIERSDRKTIQDSKQMWKSMKTEQKFKLDSAVEDHKFEQGYGALLWQFVRMGAIKKPDTSIVSTVMSRFGAELVKYGIRYDTRQWERVEIIAQHHAVMRAGYILYKTLNGKHANQKFDCSHFWDAEELMYCTEEMVIHAMGLEFDTVVCKSHAKTLEAIWRMHKNQGASATYRLNGAEPDCNYIELSGSLKTISKKICNTIKESGKHASLVNIQSTLIEMKNDMQIKCACYKKEGNAAKFNDQYPETMLGDNDKQSYDQLLMDGNKIFIHIHMFRDIRLDIKDNIYKKVVQKLTHKFTARKKIVLGMNLPSEPYHWDTVQYAPSDEIISRSDGPKAAHRAYAGITGEMQDNQIEIDADLDDIAAKNRGISIGRPVELYKPNPYDNATHQFAYPLRPKKRSHEDMIEDDLDTGF